jgi:hypothetical protein
MIFRKPVSTFRDHAPGALTLSEKRHPFLEDHAPNAETEHPRDRRVPVTSALLPISARARSAADNQVSEK